MNGKVDAIAIIFVCIGSGIILYLEAFGAFSLFAPANRLGSSGI